MRLFIAVTFNDEVKGRLLEVQERIKARSARGNFTGRENIHLTLAFIGETAPGLVPHIVSVIKNALEGAPGSFTLNFRKTGCYGRGGKELWWIGPGDSAENRAAIAALEEIRRRIAVGLDGAGIPYDRRPFRAHITLGREIKPAAPIIPFETAVPVPVNRISLMRSEHAGGKLVYSEIFGQNLEETQR